VHLTATPLVTLDQTPCQQEVGAENSPYLLSGLMRCGVCGGRITIQVSRRRKASGRVYQYARYRCSFYATKGPAVCTNALAIRQNVLEVTLLAKFQEALTPEMLDDLAVEAERRRVETELARLVEFVTKGELDSPRLREEIRDRERQLADLDQQLEHARRQGPAPLQVHRTWVEEKLRNLPALVLRDPQRARLELQKHIEDLRWTPDGERMVKISGRAKTDGLLGEEAVCLQLVAGAGWDFTWTPRARRKERSAERTLTPRAVLMNESPRPPA